MTMQLFDSGAGEGGSFWVTFWGQAENKYSGPGLNENKQYGRF